ncbi:hypothetical protein [Pseudoxanthomonas japonensis]|uniref:hypothetical protein n=1 Tax=Pseudoxanthomonas japonensis TaxID=69284 RepID=UPI001BCDF608|nr:hypothetical protein [Pseudoxanthomonas japonensis]
MPLLRTLVVIACLTIGLPFARAQDGAPDTSAVDAAAWGPYVRLVERSWQLGDGYRVSWQWLSPGQELREQWINPHDGKVVQTNVIRPGDTPGRLQLTSSLLGMNLQWQGRVASADEVVWAREGMVKLPYRLRFAGAGQVLYEGVKLKDEQVTDVKYTHVMKPMEGSTPASSAALPLVAAASAASSAATSPSARPSTVAVAAKVEEAIVEPTLSPADQAARNFGSLTRFNGIRLVGDDDMLEVQVLAPDTLAIQFFGPDGKRWNRYLVKARVDGSGKLDLLETAIAKNSRPDASLGSDDTLYVESQDGWFSGWRYAYAFMASGNSIRAVKTVEFMNGLRIALNDGASITRTTYRPLTQERVVQAMETSRQNAENERIAAENRRRAQAEREATWNAALQGFSQGMAQAQADQYYAQQQQDAFLAETAAQAQATAARAQRQRDEDARRAQELIAASRSQVAAAPTPTSISSAATPPSSAAPTASATASGTADKAAADAERRRQAELAEQQRKRDADAKKLADEQARQRQQREWQQSLQQARNSLQLRAATCLGGSGRYYVIGPKTSVKGCATVHYEARCTGTPQGAGVQGSQYNYIGGSCMGVGDAIAIPGSPLSCPVEQVIVRVTGVTGC